MKIFKGALPGFIILFLGANVSVLYAQTLPTSFSWTSTGPLISAKNDSTHTMIAVKDPSTVHYNGQYIVYASSVNSAGNYGMEYLHFSDWSQAGAATPYFMDSNPNIGSGYHTAPQVFYFAPQNKWYLIFQSGQPQYSTNSDPTQPQNWSAPKNFFSSQPSSVSNWIDFWIISDSSNVYLFFCGDNGNFYRSSTSLANFPNGFNTPVIVYTDSEFNLFEADNVYTVEQTGTYLANIECIGSDGHRFFRALSAPTLGGTWTPVGNTANLNTPFLGAHNVTFQSGVSSWTDDFSSGGAVIDGYDSTDSINLNNLTFLYQGDNPNNGASSYNFIPWQLGLASSKANTTTTLTPTKTNTPVPPTATFSFTPTKTNTLVPPTATFTFTATRTNTPVPPTATFTAAPPTATRTNTLVPATATNTPAPPTATNTAALPTSTFTLTPMPPTATNTFVPPTGTFTSVPPTSTNTPLPPTATHTPLSATSTNTPLPPTSTFTSVPSTATRTFTPVPPTATNTPVPPTATKTFTVVPPTATRTNTPIPPTASFTPTAVVSNGSFKVQLLSGVTAGTTNSPHPQIQIVNTGTTALNLNNVTVRYWFNCDCTTQGLQAWVDWAGLMPSGANVTGDVQVSVVPTSQGGQTDYVLYSFMGNMVLQPGQAIQVQSRFNKSDWSNMTQSNDWSFAAYSSFTDAPDVTGYLSGSLTWGQEPSGVKAAALTASSALVIPNPSTGTGTTLAFTLGGNSTGVRASDASSAAIVDASAKITLGIYTLAGRLIWSQTLTGGAYGTTGQHEVYWNERDLKGAGLANGVYLLKVTVISNGQTTSTIAKILILG